MNEEERAEIVARAIDALISGVDPNTSTTTHAGDVDDLIDVAEQRFLGSMFIAKASLQHEHEVWRSVVKRIQDAEIEAVLSEGESDEDLGELGDVVAMRRRLAAEMFEVSEQHRQQVWDTIQSRLGAKSRNSSLPDILRPFRRKSDARFLAQPPVDHAERMAPAPPRPLALGQIATSTQSVARQRVWAEVSSGAHIQADPPAGVSRKSRAGLLAIAAAAAAIAVLMAPLPSTGFAEHPVTRMGEAIGGYFGVREATPPAMTGLPPATIVTGRDATATEASSLAGVHFLEVSETPNGFAVESSKYYPQTMTGEGNGMFVQTFSSEEASIVIYQEPVGSADLAIGEHAAASVILGDGTPATLVQGSWIEEADLSWVPAGSQALVFERAGIFVAIEIASIEPLPRLLFQVAETIQ